MIRDSITNDTIFSHDWAYAERQRMLRALPRSKPRRQTPLAPGLSAHGVWMRDVSVMDRRSVKAQLAGRGAWRRLWYAACDRQLQALRPDSTLEQRMFWFHRFHHSLTLHRLIIFRDYRHVRDTIAREGILAGLSVSMKKSLRSLDEESV